ncbi:MAG: hypothetical protein ONB13_08135 [candidate division KSB1 bacterium]|nr:hypothetical protein [candidate division KSB1 bacterium]MDZ7376575.1 hypothetical protein [candidate division KSB1 bacterium]MDZ7402264.1 hypothetical protein [candidate division KSB1 bacterium]
MSRTIIFVVLLLSFLNNVNAFSQDQTRAAYLKKFNERKAWFISHFDTASRTDYSVIAAKYYRNRDVRRADEMFLKLLEKPSGDMFWMFPVVNCYMVGKDKMSDRVKRAIRYAWKTYAPSRGDTENHWAMYYASLYLMAEQWPNDPGSEWFNGKSSEENLQEAREYLFEWARITTTIGQGEFDSPDYILEYVVPTTMLAQYAQDKDVKKLGEMLTDYLLADFAVEHLDQQYIGGYSRIYEQNLMRPQYSASSHFAYVYFGVGEPLVHGWVLYPVLTSYTLPEIIYKIATDRSKPYVHRERKRVRNVIRYGEERNPPVYKYTYITKDYGIGSLQGGILQPIQQHTWGVRYTYGKPFSTIFGLHPYWSVLEIAMFFPEESKASMAFITASKTTYNNPDKWTGGSPFERTFQHKNTLIALYDIPSGTTSEHIDGFFPANLEQRILDEPGWIISKAGDTYIGWYPLQPGEWSEEYELKQQAFNTKTGTSIKEDGVTLRNYRFRSHELQNGYVVEVRSRDEIGSFDAFRAALANHIPRANLIPGNVSVIYHTIDGDVMEFTFPDQRKLNGEIVDLSKTKLFEGPFLNADVGSQQLILTYKNMKLILDFNRLEKRLIK